MTKSITGYQLSPQQILLAQEQKNNPTYCVQAIIKLQGQLNVEALVQALQNIVARHEIFRTTFHTSAHHACLQVVNTPALLAFQTVDLTAHPAPEQMAKVSKIFRQGTPFDLETGPLFHVSLLALTAVEHLLLIQLPALCADQQSLQLLFQELGHHYADHTGNNPLPEDVLQYADYAAWQYTLLTEEDGRIGQEFWHKHHLLPPPPLPPSFPGSRDEQPCAPTSFEAVISADTAKQLDRVAQKQGANLSDLLFACWQTLLWQQTGQPEKMVIGYDFDGRNYEDLLQAMGPFAKTLPIHTAFPRHTRFTDILHQLSQKINDTNRVQEYLIWPPRNHEPQAHLFLHFAYHQFATPYQTAGITFSIEKIDSCFSYFQLKLSCVQQENTIKTTFQYDPGCFQENAVRQLAEQFHTLLETVLLNPQIEISQANIISDRERQQLLIHFNQTTAPFPREKTIHQLFEEQVQRTPDEIALIFEDNQLTYRELDNRANQLAHQLQKLGIGPDKLVALCLERSFEMVIGILGILKAGGAYLPLNPTHPTALLTSIMADAQATVLLTQVHLSSQLPQHQGHTLYLDQDWSLIAAQSSKTPHSQAKPENLIYVIYTSGSTGQPKGVMNHHRALCNRIHWMQKKYTLTTEDRILQKTPYSFDVSAWEFFWPLLTGAKLVMAQPEGHKDSAYLVQLMAKAAITTVHFVPSLLQLVVSEPGLQDCVQLKRVICSGEALPVRLQDRFFAHSQAELHNLYGPTEAAIDVTCWPCQAGEARPSVPIGYPIDNIQLYILDQKNQPVPIGVMGELHIGGVGLARGYLNRPALTADKFIPDPFSPQPGQRLYKTGDVARYDVDGTIEFIGRADFQVKVRGNRVELGEIEAVLEQHAAVQQTVVTVREDTPNDKRLVAYIVPDKEQALTVQQVLHLQQRESESGYIWRELPNGAIIFDWNESPPLENIPSSWIKPLSQISQLLNTERHEGEDWIETGFHQYGLTLGENPCIFDVGAHVGYFSIMMGRQYPQAHIYAFEPHPRLFHALCTNAKLFDLEIYPFQLGLASQKTKGALTYYPYYSVQSGHLSDPISEQTAVKKYLHNHSKMIGIEDKATIDAILAEWFQYEYVDCEFYTLSDIIGQNEVMTIDLLNIDIPTAGADILAGIKREDWPKIKQIVVLLEGKENTQIKQILEQQGFEILGVKKERLAGRSRLYAKRPSDNPTSAIKNKPQANGKIKWDSPHQLTTDLRQYLTEKLPDYMIPDAFVLLPTMPLTSNGKIARNALPTPTQMNTAAPSLLVTPRTPTEAKLAAIWADVLKLSAVGVEDNFFAIGGHSLLALQILLRIRQEFQVELPLRRFFDTPTVAGLAKTIETTKPIDLAQQAIPIISRDEPLPLSFAQQRLWFMNQLEPTSTFYNIPLLARLVGPFHVEAFAYSINEITKRHDVLRTTFATTKDGHPIQLITPTTQLKIAETDLSHLRLEEREERAITQAKELIRQPFNLSQDTLLRIALFKISPTEHLVAIIIHHIIFDIWSMRLFFQELAAFYNAYLHQQTANVPDLPIQYVDFAHWQRQQFKAEEVQTQLAYWKNQLASPLPTINLPTDRLRPPIQTFRGAAVSFTIKPAIHQELHRISQRANVTVFTTLLTAFKILLSRYTGQTDILIGTPVANRRRPETENLLGFFVNTLPLRTNLAGNPRFNDLLQQVKTTILEAYDNQDIPFEKLVEELQTERDLSRNPLFQVMFVMQESDIFSVKLPDLEWSLLSTDINTTHFDLTFVITETENTLVGTFSYNSELFDESTITQMQAHYATLLDSIVMNNEQPLNTLSILTTSEQHQLLSDWNATEAVYDNKVCLPELFEMQAQQWPDVAAVVHETEQLSYQELNEQANQLAHYLRALDVGPDKMVGICLERSLNVVMAILGILKAGAAYLPLDPTHPPDRLKQLLQAAAPSVLITQQAFSAQFADSDGPILCLDGNDAHTIKQQDNTNPIHPTQSENLAYVLYTSGSTGTPKAVSCCHSGVINMLMDMGQRQPLSPKSACSLWTNVTFDVSVYEIFSALTAGCTLHIVPEYIRPSGSAFITWLAKHHIQSAYIPPFMLTELAQWLKNEANKSALYRLLVGVEPIPGPVLAAIHNQLPSLHIVNGYGPTEATICATFLSFSAQHAHSDKVPIGRPLQNMQIYLLDNDLNPVPVGVAGELYIGGAGLARGYLHHPAQTAEKFIPNPFGTGQRLYKTGDLARYQADGNITFIGRVDYQIKLRGYRIETGEIETILKQYTDIQDAVVTVQEGANGDKRLVTHVIPAKDDSIDDWPGSDQLITNLRQYLKGKLPEYMIPDAFMFLPSMPFTPNGKIDRQSLPHIAMTHTQAQNTFIAPRTPIEEQILDICQQIIGIEQISMTDNFFEIGGHSLAAAQFITQINDAFNLELPLISLFQHPRMADLAEHIDMILWLVNNLTESQNPSTKERERGEL